MAVLIAAGVIEMKAMGWIKAVPTYLAEIVAALSLSTLFIYYKLRKIPLDQPGVFTRSYLMSIVLKLLFGGAFILAVVFLDRNAAVGNGAVFVLSYLGFTGLEVTFLSKRHPEN